MTRRFATITLSVLVLVALIALAGCERPKSTGQQLPTAVSPGSAGTATPTIRAEIPPQVATTVVARETVVATPTRQAPLVLSSPTPLPPATAFPLPTPAPGGSTTHVVKPGEWLWSIARQYNVSPQAIAQANNLTDPGNLQPGQTLVIPAPGSGSVPTTPGGTGQTTHKVQTGENLFRIALKYNKTVQAIATANGITNVTMIYPGQVLIIP
jgi:LysM repeat protein